MANIFGVKGEMAITVHCPDDPNLRRAVLAKVEEENFLVQCSEPSTESDIELEFE